MAPIACRPVGWLTGVNITQGGLLPAESCALPLLSAIDPMILRRVLASIAAPGGGLMVVVVSDLGGMKYTPAGSIEVPSGETQV